MNTFLLAALFASCRTRTTRTVLIRFPGYAKRCWYPVRRTWSAAGHRRVAVAISLAVRCVFWIVAIALVGMATKPCDVRLPAVQTASRRATNLTRLVLAGAIIHGWAKEYRWLAVVTTILP